MSYLNTYTEKLTANTAAHLLRRATFGPTRQEIADFVGLTASEAVDILINNSSYRLTPPPPVEMDATRADAGQPFLNKSFVSSRSFQYSLYIKYWWIGLMTEQNGHPSILEKLTAFWQNHFVVAHTTVADYRLTDRYLRFLRANALGNFRDLVIGITKDPGMLIFQNGNENTKTSPNENYGRELQELFTVGQKDFAGNDNYTEEDVKAAARVLTGWRVTNHLKEGSTSFDSAFYIARHDTTDKAFSSKYNNRVVQGRSDDNAGDAEIADLTNMLLSHPETPKFICRKLFRWFVNPNVTQEIEDQVIIPLASFFASSANNYAIVPLIKKMLTCEYFYNPKNIGAIIKSPAEFMIGTLRFLNQPVPSLTTEYAAFHKMIDYMYWTMTTMQLNFLDQPLVFGSVPYYQMGFSKNWLNGTTIGLRGQHSDGFVYPWLQVKSGYLLGEDFITRLTRLQPNFSDVSGSPAITIEQVFQEFYQNVLAIDLSQARKDFLIDTIMMRNVPRSTWVMEWNSYRKTPNDVNKKNAVISRSQWLLKHLFRMAEYQIF